MRKKGQNCPFLLSVADLRVKGFQKPLVLALLVRYCTGSLASRLTGSLTLAAAALCSRSLQVCCIDGLNVLHSETLPQKSLTTLYHKSAGFSSVLCKNGKKFTSSVAIRRTVAFCADGYCYFGGFLWGAFTPEMPPQILPPQISSSRTGLPAVPCQNSPTANRIPHSISPQHSPVSQPLRRR